MSDTIEIKKEKLLIVEGGDDEKVLECILKDSKINNIQILRMNGVDNIQNFINKTLPTALKTTKKDDIQIKVIGIVVDSDNCEIKSRFDEICHALEGLKKAKIKDLDFDIPNKCAEFTQSNIKIGIYIIPDCNSKGMLETLCLESIKESPFYDCVNNFIKNANKIEKENSSKELDHIEKRKTLAYISLKSKDGKSQSTGGATQADIFYIKSEAFNPIRNFLIDMSELD